MLWLWILGPFIFSYLIYEAIVDDDDDDNSSRARVETGTDTLEASASDDTLTGGEEEDELNGAAGNDTLNGAGGNDMLIGGTGADTLNGGTGNDILWGTVTGDEDAVLAAVDEDTEGDLLNGGDGADILVMGHGDTAEGEAGADIFLSGTWADSDPGLVGDFNEGEGDEIVIVYDPNEFNDTPTLSVTQNIGAFDVLLNGIRVLSVDGDAPADAAAIQLRAETLVS